MTTGVGNSGSEGGDGIRNNCQSYFGIVNSHYGEDLDSKMFRNRIEPADAADRDCGAERMRAVTPSTPRTNVKVIDKTLAANLLSERQKSVNGDSLELRTLHLRDMGQVDLPETGFIKEKPCAKYCSNTTGYDRGAHIDEVMVFNAATPYRTRGMSVNERKGESTVLARGVRMKDDPRRCLLRQSSSVESVTQGFTPVDGIPLLKLRCSTLGNVSLDSTLGYANPCFDASSIYSRNSSREDQSQVPLKRHRSDTQFSDDFAPFSPGARNLSEESFLSGSEHVNSRAPKLASYVKSGSIDSLLNDFGGAQVSFREEIPSRMKPRPKSRSHSTDDLILEDIEDCDIEALVTESIQSACILQAGNNSLSTDQSSSLLQSDLERKYSKSESLYHNRAFDLSSVATDEGYAASVSSTTSTPYQTDTVCNWATKQGWHGDNQSKFTTQTNKQSQTRTQNVYQIHEKSDTKTPHIRSTCAKDTPKVVVPPSKGDRKENLRGLSGNLTGKPGAAITATPNLWHIQRVCVST